MLRARTVGRIWARAADNNPEKARERTRTGTLSRTKKKTSHKWQECLSRGKWDTSEMTVGCQRKLVATLADDESSSASQAKPHDICGSLISSVPRLPHKRDEHMLHQTVSRPPPNFFQSKGLQQIPSREDTSGQQTCSWGPGPTRDLAKTGFETWAGDTIHTFNEQTLR